VNTCARGKGWFSEGRETTGGGKTIDELEASFRLQFLSWYALGPTASPSSEFIEKSRVCYISGSSAWTLEWIKDQTTFH
jgi:hypothetical protein